MANKQFTTAPTIHMSRSRFDLSYDHKMSMSAGKLYPASCIEVYPGDSFSISLADMERVVSSFIRPVVDNAYIDFYWFFVPSRLVYDRWAEIFGENRKGYWAQKEAVSAPVIDSQFEVNAKTVGDYLGLPIGSLPSGVNILPFRAFALIWDQWFRDENLIDPMYINTGEFQASETPNNNTWSQANYCGQLPPVSKFHDLFTSALPSTQKGSDIPIPLGTYAPVVPLGNPSDPSDTERYMHQFASGNSLGFVANNFTDMYLKGITAQASTGYKKLVGEINVAAGDNVNIEGWNLYASLADAGTLSVPDLRYAFQLQRILERSARCGTRYKEYLLSAWGVSAPDSRLQQSEYLFGTRHRLNIQQVANTQRGTDEDTALGSLGAYSLTADNSHMSKGFVEHGFLMCVSCIRQYHTYSQGIPRYFMRSNRFDYYDPTLAYLSEQPVYKSELYAPGSTDLKKDIFGYNEAWYDLRSRPNTLSGEMRPDVENSLDIWHFGDDFGNAPTLNGQFINETPVNIDRTLKVPSTSQDQFILDLYFKISAIRVLPAYSIPGLLDHH